MAQRPPPPPPRRRAPTLEKLRRIEARERERERPFDPEQPAERYARPHHFAVNPSPWEDIAGEQMSFPGSDPDDILATDQPYGAWSRGFGGDWFVPRWLGGSDYSGGYVTRANFLSFKAEWEDHDPPFFTEAYGGHGTYGIILYIPRTPDEVWEQLEKLDDYPLLDEDKLSELEREGMHEAWERWAKDEYLRLWRNATEDDPRFADDWMDGISDESWWEHFEACASEANEYWHADGDSPSMTIDVERVFEACADTPPEPVGGIPDPHEAAILGLGPDPERASALDERRQRQIDELRRQLDRPYRRFEQNARKTINDLLAEDPYRGIHTGAHKNAQVVNNIGRIVSQSMGLLEEYFPYEAATLLLRADDGSFRIVLWYRVGDRYTLMWMDPEPLFESQLLRMGTVSDVQEWAESPVIGGDGRPHVHEDDWDIVLRSLHHRGADALALYLEWYDRAGVQPTLLDYGKQSFYVDNEVDWAEMQVAFGGVFEMYERHKASVEDVMGLLGMRGGEAPARAAPAPATPSGPSALELRRRRLIDYARAELDRPFPRRFEPNPAGGLAEWLAADPYAGVVVRKDDAYQDLYEPGVVEANVLHDQEPHEMAGLVLRKSDGNPMLVLWYGSPEGSPRDYTAFFIDPTQLQKILPVFSVKNVGAVGEAMEDEISPELWEDVLTAINRTLTGDMQTTQYLAGLLLYLYWYFEAQLENPSLAELAEEEHGEAVVVRSDVRAVAFESAWNEVFAVEHSGPVPPPVPSGRASSAPAAVEPSGRASDLRRRQIEYARQMLDRPFTRRFEENPPRLWEVRSDEGLEGVFGDEAQAERYAETLRTELAVRAWVVEATPEKLPGGLAQGRSPEQFDPVELARGTFVEMEHTDDADLAREIAMDHLVEDPLYYQKLQAAGL